MHTPLKSRWLLVMCGVLEAVMAIVYLIMYETGPDGPITFHEWNVLAVFLTRVALAAGVCTIAAGISARGKSSLLILTGFALSAYGLAPLIFRPANFSLFALLMVVMAMTVGVLALAIARRDPVKEWFFAITGSGSIVFALAFLALMNGWIQLERRPFHSAVFLWMCVYFGFSAMCMVGLGRRLDGLWEASSLIANPGQAH